MNAITAIVAGPDGWDAASTAVNTWRGQCMSSIARGEMAVSETLLAMSRIEGRSPPIELPVLIGKRIGALRQAIAPGGAFHAEGAKALAALDVFAGHSPLRNFLCHSPGKIALERSRRWLIVLEALTFASGQPQRSVRVIREEDSETLRKRLHADMQRLDAHLGNLRIAIGGV